jgi:hypothetical protein
MKMKYYGRPSTWMGISPNIITMMKSRGFRLAGYESRTRKTISAYRILGARFEIFTAVMFHVEVFCVMTPCSVVVGYQRFGGPCCHHLQGKVVGVGENGTT